mmetsp:Transcript_37005/g.83201  ORF Transcript_37005/g.83201 Transcript_37005/m.83201 type:complete len:200 (+) Transcript_37005:1378-1977(+)
MRRTSVPWLEKTNHENDAAVPRTLSNRLGLCSAAVAVPLPVPPSPAATADETLTPSSLISAAVGALVPRQSRQPSGKQYHSSCGRPVIRPLFTWKSSSGGNRSSVAHAGVDWTQPRDPSSFFCWPMSRAPMTVTKSTTPGTSSGSSALGGSSFGVGAAPGVAGPSGTGVAGPRDSPPSPPSPTSAPAAPPWTSSSAASR